MKIVSYIPVRGGSKSIRFKNIKKIAGKPLVFWNIDAALKSKYIEEIFIATDSNEIKQCIESKYKTINKVRVIDRSPETATDFATSESALLEFAEKYDFDFVFFQQATSPLTTKNDLDNAFEKLNNSSKDSLLSVVRQKRFIWENKNGEVSPYNYNPSMRPRRQEFEGFLVENGAFYLNSRKNILKHKCRISGKIVCHEMPEDTYFEIDEPTDWIIIEKLLQNRVLLENALEIPELKIIFIDIDGTMTDGGMYYTENGETMKKFNTRDAKGIELIRKQGIQPIIITSENSKIVASRMKKLKLEEFYLGVENKLNLIKKILGERNVPPKNVAFVGDDINDLPSIQFVGFSACPRDAEEEIKKNSNFISNFNGGNGAVREICNLILENMHKS